MDNYRTIESVAEGAYKEKGSKFLAYAHPVTSEEEVKRLMADYKKMYYDARHHCYAWQLGPTGADHRVNDDGEPSGTAGKPIHGQIRSNNLTNILIVVVRYFGGTKLGTSGLINAYKLAAADAIANAQIIEKTVDDHYRLLFDYGVMNDVMRVFKEEDAHIEHQDFNLNCTISFFARQSMVERIVHRLEKIESARLEFLYSC